MFWNGWHTSRWGPFEQCGREEDDKSRLGEWRSADCVRDSWSVSCHVRPFHFRLKLSSTKVFRSAFCTNQWETVTASGKRCYPTAYASKVHQQSHYLHLGCWSTAVTFPFVHSVTSYTYWKPHPAPPTSHRHNPQTAWSRTPVTLIRSKWRLKGTQNHDSGPRDWKIHANCSWVGGGRGRKTKPALPSCSHCGSSRSQIGNQLL